MYNIREDRPFWIYFIVTFFAIIVALAVLIPAGSNVIVIILWVLGAIFLLLMINNIISYHSPRIGICLVDSNVECLNPNYRMWLVLNIIFIVLLIFMLLWAAELNNPTAGTLRETSSIIIILGGVYLCGLTWYLLRDMPSDYHINKYILLLGVLYSIIWVGFSIFTICYWPV
jgi:hypothetical protein